MAKNIKLIVLIIIFGLSAYASANFYGKFLEDKATENIEIDESIIKIKPRIDANASSTIEIN